MDLVLYPSSPKATVSPKVSGNFRRQAWNVVLSIVAFFIVFLLLVAFVTGLALAAFWLSFMIIAAYPSFITLLLAVGVLITGISLLYFIVKFIFARSGPADTQLIELKKEDQPHLFLFLRKLTEETKTTFPHKVFLSAGVNAAVTRRVSFFNMLIPARKNLEIGVGLINAVNISEFKAVMAHEFGHFSQRSIRLGSFIYNVNRVIYNMLFENSGYTNFINGWARIHTVLHLFARVTVKISQFIQSVLRGMYVFINKNYRALSREMEYNADDIAATVAGGNNLISAFEKVNAANYAYDNLIVNANVMIASGTRLKNIYGAQTVNISKGGYRDNQSRVNFRNQWASHPTDKERAHHLSRLNIESAPVEDSAWMLFENALAIQERMTDNLYATVTFESTPSILEREQYNTWLTEAIAKKAFPKAYNGYFDNRYLTVKSDELTEAFQLRTSKSFAQLFSTENANLWSRIENAFADLRTVEAIAEKDIAVKSFDFDGAKYDAQDAGMVTERLKIEIEELKRKLHDLDMETVSWFYHNVTDRSLLKEAYGKYFHKHKNASRYAGDINEAIAIMNTLGESVTIEKANEIGSSLRQLDTRLLGIAAKELAENDILSDDLRNRLVEFRIKSHVYFSSDGFMDNEIAEFHGLVRDLSEDLSAQQFIAFKSLLETQIQMANH